ncbi:PSMC3 interacting protein [Podila epigama]|nr:PSMC3 interacting protein [Podila epigama]
MNTLVDKDLDTIDTASPEQLAQVDREISELKTNIEDAKARNKRLASELNTLNLALTSEQITERLSVLAAKNEKDTRNLELLRSGSQIVSADEKAKVIKEMEYHRKLWMQRRRLFKDMFGQVTENLPGKPKDLLEELDIDMNDPIDINTNPLTLLQA